MGVWAKLAMETRKFEDFVSVRLYCKYNEMNLMLKFNAEDKNYDFLSIVSLSWVFKNECTMFNLVLQGCISNDSQASSSFPRR